MSRIRSKKLGQDLSIVFTQQNNIEGILTFNGTYFTPSHPITGNKVAVISGDAIDTAGAVTLTAAQSGSMFLFDKADGLTYTLPTAVVGLHYKFFITVASSAANYGIDTDGTDNFEGLIVVHDKDQVYDAASLLQHLAIGAGTATHIDMTSTTTGGLQGGWIDVVAITTDRWAVRGDLVGDTNVVTCFS